MHQQAQLRLRKDEIEKIGATSVQFAVMNLRRMFGDITVVEGPRLVKAEKPKKPKPAPSEPELPIPGNGG